jgi:hypothetical protein
MSDVWDVNPFKDPNRSIKSAPKWVRSTLTNEIANGKLEYKKYVPEWFKNMELSNFVGEGPFLNETTIPFKDIILKPGTGRLMNDTEIQNSLEQFFRN